MVVDSTCFSVEETAVILLENIHTKSTKEEKITEKKRGNMALCSWNIFIHRAV